jgi:hypothetical protein
VPSAGITIPLIACLFCGFGLQKDACLILLTADPDGFFKLKECRQVQKGWVFFFLLCM